MADDPAIEVKATRRLRKPKATSSSTTISKEGEQDDGDDGNEVINAADALATSTSMILYQVDYYAELGLWSHLRMVSFHSVI
jgi:hypothetical protein